MSDALVEGQIVAAHGRHFLVHTQDQRIFDCSVRGKKSDAVCGDRVRFTPTNPEQGVIESILPRTSLFMRSDAFRTKAIASNVTQLALITAPRPSPSIDLLQRCLMAAEAQGIPVLIVANKADLPEHSAWMDTLALYSHIGYRILALSADKNIEPLRPLLEGHLTLLAGQSGMGKSTLLNALLPTAKARVNSYSEYLDSGKHTTTDTRMYSLGINSALIDSPGFQEFSLAHLNLDELAHTMPDFREYLGNCRFRNCLHRQEPGCAIQGAVTTGKIAASRLHFFHRIQAENRKNHLY